LQEFDEPNIIANVSNLIQLSTKRDELSYSVKSTKMFSEFDVEMEAIKNVLLENIESYKTFLQVDMNQINRNIARAEGEVSQLPETSTRLYQNC